MFKMYRGEAGDDFKWTYIRVHPSSWFLSALTRHTFIITITSPAFVFAGALLSAGPIWLAPLAIALFAWSAFAWVRFFTSYKMKGERYNIRLLPLERRYHRMSCSDKKKYAKYLESAYKMCSMKGEVDDTRLQKIGNLFALREKETNVLYDDLDQELRTVREIAQIQLEAQNEVKKITDGLNNVF